MDVADTVLERESDGRTRALVVDGTGTYGYAEDGTVRATGLSVVDCRVYEHPTGDDPDAAAIERYLRTDLFPGLRNDSPLWEGLLERVEFSEGRIRIQYRDDDAGFRFDATLAFER
ncbi:MAG: hypothetical protein ACOCPX_05640 [Halapricum sp.]